MVEKTSPPLLGIIGIGLDSSVVHVRPIVLLAVAF